jgi:hypothetical protein
MRLQVALQKLVYEDVRKQFNLSTQLTIRAIAKVVEAYKRDKSKQCFFKPIGAVVYDPRILSFKGLEKASLHRYKAKRSGVFVRYIDPWYTSRTCSACGHAGKANRKIQSLFQCVSCGHVANADNNAAVNIAVRADVMQSIVMRAIEGNGDGPSTATSLLL